MKKLLQKIRYLYYIWTGQTFDILTSGDYFRNGDTIMCGAGKKAEILNKEIYKEGTIYTVRSLKDIVITQLNGEQQKSIYKLGCWK